MDFIEFDQEREREKERERVVGNPTNMGFVGQIPENLASAPRVLDFIKNNVSVLIWDL